MLVSTPAAARKFRLPQISAILAGLFFVAIASFTILRPVVVLPRMTPAPRFALVDQHNGWLLDSDLRGQIVIYNFTYTNCTGTCPQTSFAQRAKARVSSAPGKLALFAACGAARMTASWEEKALITSAAQESISPRS